jgi:hypothetical protein
MKIEIDQDATKAVLAAIAPDAEATQVIGQSHVR